MACQARGLDAFALASGAAASGLPQALFTPRLENAERPHATALINAFDYAGARYGAALAPTGVRRVAADGEEARRFTALAARWDNLQTDGNSLWMTRAGVLDPASALSRLADEAAGRGRVADLARSDGVWTALDSEGRVLAEAETLILAAGAGCAAFGLCQGLTLQGSAGQLGVHRTRAPLAEAVAGPVYATPFDGHRAVMGATHEAWSGDEPPAPVAAKQSDLLKRLAERRPDIAAALEAEANRLWTGVRATTQDRLPLAGAIGEGAYILSGLGSRGFAHAPLLAEAIAAEIAGDPSPIRRGAVEAFDPARFARRRARRQG